MTTTSAAAVANSRYTHTRVASARALEPDETAVTERLVVIFGSEKAVATTSGRALRLAKDGMSNAELAWLKVLRRRWKTRTYSETSRRRAMCFRQRCEIVEKENALLHAEVRRLQAALALLESASAPQLGK